MRTQYGTGLLMLMVWGPGCSSSLQAVPGVGSGMASMQAEPSGRASMQAEPSAGRGQDPRGCFLEGAPQVVATHVAPRGGIIAAAEGSLVRLEFSTTALDPARVAVQVDPASLEVVDQEITRVAPAAVPHGTVEVRFEDGRGLLAWTEGSVYEGIHVVAQGFSDVGQDAPLDLGFEGSAIGQPAATLTSAGRGVLAFIESYGAGFHLVVTRLTCRGSEQGA
jgi:hypothetical protein